MSFEYYSRIGASLFPIPAGDKIPAKSSRPYLDCSADPEQWAKWQSLYPGWNWILVAGPSNLIIVDIDAKRIGQEAAWKLWSDWCKGHGLQVYTPQVITPSGGWHVYFSVPAGLDLGQPALCSGIDIRAGNGYVLIPPSVIGGVPYSFVLADASSPYPAPQCLIDHCLAPPRGAAKPDANFSQGYDKSEMATFIKAGADAGLWDERDDWRNLGMALKVEYGDEGYALWELSHNSERAHRDGPGQWKSFSGTWRGEGDVTLDTTFALAHRFKVPCNVRRSVESLTAGVEVPASSPSPSPVANEPLPEHGELSHQQAAKLEDFWWISPQGCAVYVPSREMWPATSVNGRIGGIPIPMVANGAKQQASTWLANKRACEQMTWAPGLPEIIEDKLVHEGGWIRKTGCRIFNLYRPPNIKTMEGDAKPWLDHCQLVFGEDACHIVKWLAQRVQAPHKKINHALVLGGRQGTGKDTLLEPVKHAVGHWNFAEISPQQMLGRFNGFVKSVILRVSEARDLGDVDRYAFYEHIKTLTAAPPDVLRVDEKHTREYSVLNVTGLIITTNNKDSIHLPADDRRHFVAWSDKSKEDFPDGYFSEIWNWLEKMGGNEIVANYLAKLDLSEFNEKAPPPKTSAFWEIVDNSRAPQDAELADALDAIGRPAAVTVAHISSAASLSFKEWLTDTKNRRRIPHRFEECGYVVVRNPYAKDGFWKVWGKRAQIYAKHELPAKDQIAEAEKLRSEAPQIPSTPLKLVSK